MDRPNLPLKALMAGVSGAIGFVVFTNFIPLPPSAEQYRPIFAAAAASAVAKIWTEDEQKPLEEKPILEVLRDHLQKASPDSENARKLAIAYTQVLALTKDGGATPPPPVEIRDYVHEINDEKYDAPTPNFPEETRQICDRPVDHSQPALSGGTDPECVYPIAVAVSEPTTNGQSIIPYIPSY